MKLEKITRLDELHGQKKWTLEELNELGQLYKEFYEYTISFKAASISDIKTKDIIDLETPFVW